MFRAMTTAAAAALLAGAPALSATWDMPVAYPAGNYLTELAVEFGDCVTDRTGGEIEVVVHPNGSLFSGADIKRAVQTGQAPIGERLLSAHENENPLFGIDTLPFTATSFDASDALWEAAGPAFDALLDSQNLVMIYSAQWGPQGLYTKKEVNSADDLKGVKFRAYSAGTARIAELAGMVPVQIEAAELSQALATGVVDSFISSGTTGVDVKAWETLSHWYDVQAWIPRNTVFANKDAFNALPQDQQDTIMSCGAQTAENGKTVARDLAQGLVEELRDNGMVVEPPSDQLRTDLEGFGAIMVDEWLEKAGDTGRDVIKAYRSTQ